MERRRPDFEARRAPGTYQRARAPSFLAGSGPAAADPMAHRPSEVDPLEALCHDLRSPTATIRALVTALGIEHQLSPGAHARLDQIVAETTRIDELCRHVLAGRPEGLQLTRLDHVAGRVVEEARAGGYHVELVTSAVVACIDAVDADRILTNLVDNACRAVGQEGRVLVSLSNASETVRVEVDDSGPGFGSGPPGWASLGLTIVRALSERNGGQVELGQSELGGARVSVTLPRPEIDLTTLPDGSPHDGGPR